MLPVPQVLRIARKLEQVWTTRPQPDFDSVRSWRVLETLVADSRSAQKQIRLARRYRLELILPRLTEELTSRLGAIGRQAEQLRQEFDLSATLGPTLTEWVQEVRQLEAEFGAVEVRWPDKVLRVVTEPIVLDDIPLGPFAIDFGWDSGRFRGARSFEVIALEPHPAAGRDEVVHPHVDGRRLCAGNAGEPLSEALDAGRLADAFLLVRSVLATYNANSPYVPLSEWHGFACSDCGQRCDASERSTCERCDSRLCDDCSSSCARCSETHCADCLEPCAVCRDSHCSGCLLETTSHRTVCRDCRKKCPQCEAILGSDELDAATGFCADCSTGTESDESQTPEPIPEEIPTHAS